MTPSSDVINTVQTISIHTPTRGVTLLNQYPGLYENDFNPHSHKGSDNGFRWSWRLLVISIHTPTRGVTQEVADMADKPIDFNPHSHKGSDKECVELGSNLTISIHTPTRGVTDNGKQEGIYMQFQSTLPQGE